MSCCVVVVLWFRRLDALRQNDFEAYKELLRQTHGPQTDDDRFKGEATLSGCYWLQMGRQGLG